MNVIFFLIGCGFFLLLSAGNSDPAKLELKAHDVQQLSTDELQKRQMEIKVRIIHDLLTW